MRQRVAVKLSLARRLLVAASGVAAVAVPLAIGVLNVPAIRSQPQTPSGAGFEVASVKLNESDRQGRNVPVASHGRLEIENFTLMGLIAGAYNLPRVQIEGLPPSLASDRYNISARAAGDLSEKQMWPMVQKLLAERFKLQVHRETRESPIYGLVVNKGGLLLKDGSAIAVSAAQDCAELPIRNPDGGLNLITRCGSFAILNGPRGYFFSGRGVSMAEVAGALPVDRVIVDRTGLTDRYNFHLQWTPDDYKVFLPVPEGANPIPDNSDVQRLTIFAALEEQLGLKLESSKADVQYLVIDHIERLLPN